MNQKSCRNCLFRSFSFQIWAAAGEKSKDRMAFSKYILFSKQNKRVFWDEMATNDIERDILILTKRLVVNKHMLH